METKYTYSINAQWHQHNHTFVELAHGAPRTINFSAPPEFGGEAGMWTPEDFFVASVASCFVATFRGVARASRLEFQGIEVTTEGTIEPVGAGWRFTTINLRPVLIIYAEEAREKAQRLLEKAERGCLIAQSLSATVKLEAKIMVEKPVTA